MSFIWKNQNSIIFINTRDMAMCESLWNTLYTYFINPHILKCTKHDISRTLFINIYYGLFFRSVVYGRGGEGVIKNPHTRALFWTSDDDVRENISAFFLPMTSYLKQRSPLKFGYEPKINFETNLREKKVTIYYLQILVIDTCFLRMTFFSMML